MISSLNVQLPDKNRNYTTVDAKNINEVLVRREHALPDIKAKLQTTNDEKEIVGCLYLLDIMLDKGVKGVDTLYPELSRFNDTDSPNIQTFLAGIYRKTKVPDAFGPLVNMLIGNSIKNAHNKINGIQTEQLFDPNEEIGGAIIDYLA